MKNVKKINEPVTCRPIEISKEVMQRDYDFAVGEMINKMLLDEGLITKDESLRLRELNKKSFNPLYAEIID